MIPLFRVYMSDFAARGVGSVLQSGFIGQGPVVEAFEDALSEFTPYPAVATHSCTSAIHLVLTHLGVGPGDEVITTPMTCIATNAPILAVGARIVWADVDSVTGLISPESVRQRLTGRTRAIIAVDWSGRMADYHALRMAAPGIPLIQDAAHDPLLAGPAGEFGDFICYSFGPIKHLTCGDGGAVAHIDPRVREDLRLRRWYGLDRSSSKDFRCAQDIEHFGMKWHMNDINAAIGLANVPALPRLVKKHQDNARLLHDLIWNKHLWMPPFDPASNYWVFPILVADGLRDSFKAWMESHGVACSQVHARNDRHAAYAGGQLHLPGVDAFDSRQANIPCGWWLTEDDLLKIARAVNAFVVTP